MAGPARRVLITGASGFTGRYLADELRSHGYDVFGTGSAETGSDLLYRKADLLDPAALRALLSEWQPQLIVHLAALAFVGHGNPDDFYKVNVIGTRHLLEAIADCVARPECVLVASSANIYGNADGNCLDETTPPAPANDYAVSKLAMEYVVRLWQPKLPIVVARPFNYTGVGQGGNFLLPKIVDHFKRGAPRIELGNLDVSRDFSDVRTVVSVYRRLLEEPAAIGQVLNVSSGVSRSLREVVELCSELAGRSIEVVVNPDFVRNNEVKTLLGDNSKLRSFIGSWDAIELRDTLRWMLSA